MPKCEKCGKSYDGVVCPWCREEAPEPVWPILENGEGEKPKRLCCVDKGFNGEMIVSMLKAFGIPVYRSYPFHGRLANVVLGDYGAAMELHVPESMYEEAKRMLEESKIDMEDEPQ